MQVVINFVHSRFLRVQKFCEFNFHDPTPIVKLCVNKVHTKISGNTVIPRTVQIMGKVNV